MTQDQHFDKFLQDAYTSGRIAERIAGYEYSLDPNWISLPVDAFGSDSNTVFRLAVFESLSLGNSKDVGLSKVCFEFHPSISVGYVKDVLTQWGCEFTSEGVVQDDIRNPAEMPITYQPVKTRTCPCDSCSPAEVHECMSRAKN